jgi:hypothetical protein
MLKHKTRLILLLAAHLMICNCLLCWQNKETKQIILLFRNQQWLVEVNFKAQKVVQDLVSKANKYS